MKYHVLLTTLLFVISISNLAIAHEPSEKEKPGAADLQGLNTEAGQAVVLFHKALSDGDADKVMSLLSPEVIILEGSRIERSAEEYRLHHLPADLRFSSAVNTTTIEHYVRTFENTAVSISRSHTTGEYKGKPIDKKGNETITLTLVDKQWKISHIHWSH